MNLANKSATMFDADDSNHHDCYTIEERSQYFSIVIFISVLFIFLLVLYVLFFKWVFEVNDFAFIILINCIIISFRVT